MACKFVVRGSSDGNSATKYVSQYMDQLRLKELGIYTDSSQIDELTQEIFLYISKSLDRIRRLKEK